MKIILLLSIVIHTLLFLCCFVKEFILSLIVNSYKNLYIHKIRNNKYFWHSRQTNSIYIYIYSTYLLRKNVEVTIVHNMKAVEGKRAVAVVILKHGTKWRLVSFTARGRLPSTQQTGGWVGPRDALDVPDKRNVWSPYQESNPFYQPCCSLVHRLCYQC
jgi:hypothetical protein